MRAAAVSAIVLALTPLAHAQSGCDLIAGILGEATTGYVTILGDRFDDNWYDTSSYLDGADECAIGIGAQGSVYECVWSETTAATADRRLDTLETLAKGCLAGWDRISIAGETSTNGLKIGRGYSYRENSKFSVELYRETLGSGEETEVWFRIHARPFPSPPEGDATVIQPATPNSPTPSAVVGDGPTVVPGPLHPLNVHRRRGTMK